MLAPSVPMSSSVGNDANFAGDNRRAAAANARSVTDERERDNWHLRLRG